MSNRKNTKQEQELKTAIMDELEDALDGYLESFRLKSKDGESLPTISEIEDILTDLRSKTRDIYLKMVSESITYYDEANLIASKKATTAKEG